MVCNFRDVAFEIFKGRVKSRKEIEEELIQLGVFILCSFSP